MTTGLRTRRRLLAGGIAAALVAATGLPVQALGRRGGVLKAGLSAEGFQIALSGATGQTLTEISGDGSLIPALAERWEPLDAGRIWRIEMRDAVPGAYEVLSRFGTVDLEGVQATVTLPEADPDFPLRLAAPDQVVPGESGLYRVLSDEGDALRLTRQTPHWKEARAGWADELVLIRIEDPAARLAALRQARVDVIDGLDAHATTMLAAREDVVVTSGLAVSDRVGLPQTIGSLWPLDNGRMAERWWLG